MAAIIYLTVYFLLSISALEFIRRLAKKSFHSHKPLLPPGPSPLHIVGNVLQIDTQEPWITYTNWGKTYGDIVYSRFLNQDVIIINSERVAKDLLDLRSKNYSDKPVVASLEIFGWSWNTIALNYGDTWRQHRRVYHQAFRAEAASKYRPLQMRKVHQLLINLLEAPDAFATHFSTLSASIIMAVTYGYHPLPRNDPLVTLCDTAVALGNEILTPEKSIILGAFPFLQRIPAWFPGSIKPRILRCRRLTSKMVETTFQYAKNNIASNTAVKCMVSDVLGRGKGDDPQLEQVLKNASATAYGAGSDTTSSSLLIFVLAMVLYPHVQERAQAEIDAVVGRDRLPRFDDRPSLPYIEAILRETLRWHPVTPLGAAHAATNADVYEGYHIPKGATVIPNVWAMSQNEEKYPNASEFKPERFITPDGKFVEDSVSYAFGFGRRICVGRHVADASIWAGMVSMLSIFRFKNLKDEDGKDIKVNPQWVTGLTAHPVFKCSVEPRFPELSSASLEQMITSHEIYA